jgi:hypothetical protein
VVKRAKRTPNATEGKGTSRDDADDLMAVINMMMRMILSQPPTV